MHDVMIKVAQVSTFKTFDGVELVYRAWGLEGARRGVLLFHRGHEHGGRWEETVGRLGLEGAAYFAWDQRGHGDSPGVRGDAESVAVLARDAEAFSRHVAAAHGIAVEEQAVLAQSVGAVVAAAWVHDYAPAIRGMVLAVPAFKVKLYVPLAVPALRVKNKVMGNGYVKSYVGSKLLTGDRAEQAAYDNDAKIFRQISVRLLLDLADTGKRIAADAGAITVPTYVVAAGKDWVVDVGAQRAFYEGLSSGVKKFEVMGEMKHGMFHDVGREELVGKAAGFLRECFARKPEREGLARLDEGGYTRREYDRLREPGAFKWKVQRAFMKTVGRLSDGIALGHRAGFDSGVMLDYVYKNQARGKLLLGKVIDRNYLDAIGWKGIRVRREHLEKLLKETMLKVKAEGMPVHIVDIAAGGGRYVLEVLNGMREVGGVGATALLRDYQTVNLDAARSLAMTLDLKNVTIAQGDAFDEASLAGLEPRPTVAIVSGLYELFPENAPLRRSLQGLGAAVPAGGYLIYTCQPWHPQVELIARTLGNREGQPWIMRRRTQGEMDELVRQAGFEKVEQLVDRWGIFTVSVARRIN